MHTVSTKPKLEVSNHGSTLLQKHLSEWTLSSISATLHYQMWRQRQNFQLIPNSVFPGLFFHCLEGDRKQKHRLKSIMCWDLWIRKTLEPKQNNKILLCNTEMLRCPYSVWLHGLSLIKTGVKKSTWTSTISTSNYSYKCSYCHWAIEYNNVHGTSA